MLVGQHEGVGDRVETRFMLGQGTLQPLEHFIRLLAQRIQVGDVVRLGLAVLNDVSVQGRVGLLAIVAVSADLRMTLLGFICRFRPDPASYTECLNRQGFGMPTRVNQMVGRWVNFQSVATALKHPPTRFRSLYARRVWREVLCCFA